MKALRVIGWLVLGLALIVICVTAQDIRVVMDR